MFLEFLDAFYWCEKIACISIVFQTIEILMLRKCIRKDGIWCWDILKAEFVGFPVIIQKFLDYTLSYPNFICLLWIRLFLGVQMMMIIPAWIGNLTILVITILICLRWRGVFNGGSDYMTIIVFSTLSITAIFKNNEVVQLGCALYLVIQVCSSYFISGLVKIKRHNWRTGQALNGFLKSTIYRRTYLSKLFDNHLILPFMASWFIIFFELSFPLALLNPSFFTLIIATAIIFHFANYYFFGLNRFFFIWLATYPVLYSACVNFQLI